MTNVRKTLCIGALVAALAGSGCSSPSGSTPGQNVTLRGQPVSVSSSYSNGSATIATVVNTGGAIVLASKLNRYDSVDRAVSCYKITKALALIQSEIDDNDADEIELRGYYDGNEFRFGSVTANGYTVDLTKIDDIVPSYPTSNQ